MSTLVRAQSTRAHYLGERPKPVFNVLTPTYPHVSPSPFNKTRTRHLEVFWHFFWRVHPPKDNGRNCCSCLRLVFQRIDARHGEGRTRGTDARTPAPEAQEQPVVSRGYAGACRPGAAISGGYRGLFVGRVHGCCVPCWCWRVIERSGRVPLTYVVTPLGPTIGTRFPHSRKEWWCRKCRRWSRLLESLTLIHVLGTSVGLLDS